MIAISYPRLFLIMLSLVPASAITTITACAQDYGSKGYIPNQTYHASDFDSVNLSNGTLTLDIPLLSYPQRGALPAITIFINSNSYSGGKVLSCPGPNQSITVISNRHPPTPRSSPFVNATSYSGNDACIGSGHGTAGYGLVDGSGATHLLGLSASSTGWVSLDGAFTDNAPTPLAQGSQSLATDRNGITFTLSPFPSPLQNSTVPDYYGSVESVKDLSGNTMNRYPTSINGSTENYWIDSLGRNIPDAPPLAPSAGGCITRDYPGQNGGTVPLIYCYKVANEFGLTSVTLPNETSWSFDYSGGDVASVKLPTGATVSYQYEQLQSCVVGSLDNVGAYVDAVTSRSINLNNGSPVQTWTYQYSTRNNDSTSTTTIVTDPDQNDTVHTFTGIGGASCSLYETTTQYYAGKSTNGTLLKTVTTAYHDGGYNGEARGILLEEQRLGVFPTSKTTTWPSGVVSSESYWSASSSEGEFTLAGTNYPIYGENLYQKLAYDYGNGAPGPLLRETDYTYEYQANGSYLAANLLNLPYSTITYDGLKNKMASIAYGYDENNGSPQGVYGHQTSQTKLVSASQSIKTQQIFNSQGMPSQLLDGNGNATTITYDSTGLYPKEVQYPTTAGVVHMENYTYDSNTGEMVKYVDQNRQPTNYAYDSMRRVLTISYPDTGSKGYMYGDTAPSPYVTIKQPLNGSQTREDTYNYDGLGRLVEHQANSDPLGADYSEYAYDSEGRKCAESNASRTAPLLVGLLSCMPSDNPAPVAVTDGYRYYGYDQLDRLTSQQQADKSNLAWQYDQTGNKVESFDETGNHWTRTYDGLGRLLSVVEPNPNSNTPSLETDYTYNARNDLTRVDQWGGAKGATGERVRSFTYDWLSRLVSSFNPETNTICYGTYNGATCNESYDANGNLIAKTDARGVVTNYQYDALNRIKQKSYVNDPSGTPTVLYGYDSARGWIITPQTNPVWPAGLQTNLIGRLSYELNSPFTAGTIYGYDLMGRTTFKAECTPRTCGNDNYDMHFQYDLAGNLSFYDRGLDDKRNASTPNGGYYYGGHNLTYDGAGRLNTLSASFPVYQMPNLFESPTYDPLGNVTFAHLANIYHETRTYNNRGWYTGYSTVAGGTAGYGTYTYYPNGNVKTASDRNTQSWTYSYDHLNRVIAASGTPNGVSYGYDAFGNRTSQTVTAGSAPQSNVTYTTANQYSPSSGVAYDAAGNVTYDGFHHYTYDAESRLATVADTGESYVYDPAGDRVAKLVNGDVATGTEYLYDPNHRLMTTINPSYTMQQGNVYAGSRLLGDYTAGGGNFYLRMTDQVGSLRGLWGYAGQGISACISTLPFGDDLACYNSGGDVDQPFTGKPRDTESNLDYFGARYYASNSGRWMSPDWSAKQEPVPYSKLDNPQTLNLYSYVQNNPLSNLDDDGHATIEVKYNPLALGSNHSFIVVTDRNGTQTVFRAGPSVSAGTGWITPATGGSASQSATPTSSQLNSSNSSSPGAGPTAQGNPYGQLVSQQESPTDPSGDNMSTISGSATVLSNDLPALSYINGLQQFDTGLNSANIPYNPLSTNSNAYVTNALQSIGVPTPKAPVWAPGAGTNLHVTPAPPAPPPPGPPPCSVAGACSQPH